MRETSSRLLPTVLVLLLSILLSPYLSSWFPMAGGMPIGSIVRQLAFMAVFFMALPVGGGATEPELKRLLQIFAFNCVFTVVSFIHGPSTLPQFAAGVASFVFYPVLFLFMAMGLRTVSPLEKRRFYTFFDKFCVRMFLILPIIGVLDVILEGNLILALGYNPNYGGEDFFLITSYNDTVRANAGIGDALAFGYLMVVGVIYFLSRKNRVGFNINGLGLGLCTLAAVLSLTRGAMIAMFIVYLIFFFSPRRLLLLLAAGLLLFALLYNSPYNELLLGRFTDSDEASETSSLLRLVMALNSIDFLAENPMGIGIGTQGSGSTLSDDSIRLNTDNYFFHIFLELGVAFGAWFIFFLYKQFAYAARRVGSGKIVAAYVVLFVVSAALSSSIAFATLGGFFWFTLYLFVLKSEVYVEN